MGFSVPHDIAVTVCLFARARDLVGVPHVEVRLPSVATIGDLRRQLATRYPKLATLVEHSTLAIDDEFADDNHVLSDGQQVAFLPPVSGG